MTDLPTHEELHRKVNHIEHLESDLEQVRKALYQSRDRIKALLEGSHDALVITNREGQFVDCNNRALEVYGIKSMERFRSKRPADFSPPFQPDGKKSSDLAKELIEKAFEDGMLHFQWVHRRDNGEEFPAEVILVAIRIGDQEALQASIRDITEGKRTEEALRRFDKDLVPILERLAELASIALDNNRLYARMKLELAERERAARESERLQEQLFQSQKMESVGRLAGGVAHDFNNMLQVIMGHVELGLSLGPAAEPLRNDLLEIRKAAERSADLTRQLLAFARKQPAAPRILDLNDTVSGMLKMLRRLIGEDIHLIWKPGADLWSVSIDPIQVDQILANLSVNARDAINGVGNLSIETGNAFLDQADFTAGAATGEYVLLSVSDTGCGMDKETLHHVFEPFFTTKDIGKGTGLGLATVYGIVTQNEGLVNVTSGPGEGTRIDVYLPRVNARAELEQEQRRMEPERGSETTE